MFFRSTKFASLQRVGNIAKMVCLAGVPATWHIHFGIGLLIGIVLLVTLLVVSGVPGVTGALSNLSKQQTPELLLTVDMERDAYEVALHLAQYSNTGNDTAYSGSRQSLAAIKTNVGRLRDISKENADLKHTEYFTRFESLTQELDDTIEKTRTALHQLNTNQNELLRSIASLNTAIYMYVLVQNKNIKQEPAVRGRPNTLPVRLEYIARLEELPQAISLVQRTIMDCIAQHTVIPLQNATTLAATIRPYIDATNAQEAAIMQTDMAQQIRQLALGTDTHIISFNVNVQRVQALSSESTALVGQITTLARTIAADAVKTMDDAHKKASQGIATMAGTLALGIGAAVLCALCISVLLTRTQQRLLANTVPPTLRGKTTTQ